MRAPERRLAEIPRRRHRHLRQRFSSDRPCQRRWVRGRPCPIAMARAASPVPTPPRRNHSRPSPSAQRFCELPRHQRAQRRPQAGAPRGGASADPSNTGGGEQRKLVLRRQVTAGKETPRSAQVHWLQGHAEVCWYFIQGSTENPHESNDAINVLISSPGTTVQNMDQTPQRICITLFCQISDKLAHCKRYQVNSG